MIVWGGYGQGTLADGAIYTPGSVASPGNTLRAARNSAIRLNWSAVFGAGSYNVRRCGPGTTGCIPGTVISTPTISQYSEPDDGASHFYAVEAVNQCGSTP